MVHEDAYLDLVVAGIADDVAVHLQAVKGNLFGSHTNFLGLDAYQRNYLVDVVYYFA